MRTAGLAILLVTLVPYAVAEPPKLEGTRFSVEVAEPGRTLPFRLELPKSLVNYTWSSSDPEFPIDYRAVSESGIEISLTFVWFRIYGVLPRSISQGTHTFQITSSVEREADDVNVEATANDQGNLQVRIGGELVTAYHYSTDRRQSDRKPYLWPVLGEGGASLTRDWPSSGVEGKTKDHPHHVSFWTAHGDINGADFWEYGERTGWQRPGDGIFKVLGGPGAAAGWISANNVWEDKDHQPVVKEDRSYIFYNTPANERLIDITVNFTAEYGEVKFGDTKEGGIVALRMNDDLRETGGTGKITTSEGAVGEKAAWGKAAAWCDYSGTLEGFGARGIAVMDSPQSFRYPVHWHVRGYGLMAANPFGYSDFTGGKENGDYTLPKGESIEFSYRIYLHTGDATAADVAGHYRDFANPPVAKWIE